MPVALKHHAMRGLKTMLPTLDLGLPETPENSLSLFCERYRAVTSEVALEQEHEMTEHLSQTMDLCRQFLEGAVNLDQFHDVHKRARQNAIAFCAAGSSPHFRESTGSRSESGIVEYTYPYELMNYIKKNISEDTGLVTGLRLEKRRVVRLQLWSYPHGSHGKHDAPGIN